MNTAIITGASSGMGREFVKMTAQRGDIDEIWVVARRRDRLEALQQEVSVPLHVLPLDLLREESFTAFQSELESRRPNVTFLVNASGFGRFGRNDQIPLQDDLDMIDLNCKALVRITKLTLPYMPRGSRQPYPAAGQPFRLPAGTLYRYVRRHQGLCAQLFPKPQRGAPGPGHQSDGLLPRLGQNGLFRPRLDLFQGCGHLL